MEVKAEKAFVAKRGCLLTTEPERKTIVFSHLFHREAWMNSANISCEWSSLQLPRTLCGSWNARSIHVAAQFRFTNKSRYFKFPQKQARKKSKKMIKFSLIHHTWQAHERRIASFFIYEDDFLLLHRMEEEQFSEIENFPRLFFIRGNFLTLCSSNFRSDARKSEENFWGGSVRQ